MGTNRLNSEKMMIKNLRTSNRRITMRRYIFLFTLLTFVVVGCNDQTSIISPDEVKTVTEPNWISLPSMSGSKGMSVMSIPIFQASEIIDGSKGGKIMINEKYNGRNGEVKVKAELEFPRGAFEGEKLITMVLDTDFGCATFSPHAYFDKDAIYNAEFQGLDLSEIDKREVKNIGFVYQAEDGTYEQIDYSKLEVDLKNGKLKVKDAKLPHFSRYGFVN